MAEPRIARIDPADPDRALVSEAARLLREGGLVAFPTETVYGLGANALNAEAVRRVFEAKRRPLDNPLIVHTAGAEDLEQVAARVTPLARRLAEQFWPGPLTLVLEAGADVPAAATGGHRTVAVRVPDHPVALALLRAAGLPIAAPSANRSGRPSPTTAAHVAADLDGAVDLVLDAGACALGVESTVVDARGEAPVILREGAVTREDLGPGARTAPADAAAASPGARYRHYAPSCRVEIAEPGTGPQRAARAADAGKRVGLVARQAPTHPDVVALAQFADADELARALYEALRAGEAAGADLIIVEAVDETGIGRAVMDRLRRAGGG